MTITGVNWPGVVPVLTAGWSSSGIVYLLNVSLNALSMFDVFTLIAAPALAPALPLKTASRSVIERKR